MAKNEITKMTVSLDPEAKRLLRNLTKSLDRLARAKSQSLENPPGAKRLKEPVEDGPPSQVGITDEREQDTARSVINQKSYLQ